MDQTSILSMSIMLKRSGGLGIVQSILSNTSVTNEEEYDDDDNDQKSTTNKKISSSSKSTITTTTVPTSSSVSYIAQIPMDKSIHPSNK
jgi:hypothetical protein